jgi:hypothetical protein
MIEMEANALTQAVRQADHKGQRVDVPNIYMHLFNLVVY